MRTAVAADEPEREEPYLLTGTTTGGALVSLQLGPCGVETQTTTTFAGATTTALIIEGGSGGN